MNNTFRSSRSRLRACVSAGVLSAVLATTFASGIAQAAETIQETLTSSPGVESNPEGIWGNYNGTRYAYLTEGDTLDVSFTAAYGAPSPRHIHIYDPSGELRFECDTEALVDHPTPIDSCTVKDLSGPEGVWKIVNLDEGEESGDPFFAFEIAVRNNGTPIPGRIWSDYIGLWQDTLFHLTDDFWFVNDFGYEYKMSLYNYQGYGSRIIGDQLGNGDGTGTCTSAYRSVQLAVEEDGGRNDYEVCNSYRLFTEEPAMDLPEYAQSADGQIAVRPKLDADSFQAQNFNYVADLPDSPHGGVTFELPGAIEGAQVEVQFDLDGDGEFETVVVPTKDIALGLFTAKIPTEDASGKPIDPCASASARVFIKEAGEFHARFWDVEGMDGVEIERLNGFNSDHDKRISWDDSGLDRTNEWNTADVDYPEEDVTGDHVDSTGGVHGWAMDQLSWGNNRLIDNWASESINSAVGEIPLFSSCVAISKDDHKAVVETGEETTYDIDVTNTSAGRDAAGVVVTDTLPAGLEFVSASDGGVFDESTRTVTWNVGVLAANSAQKLQVTAKVVESSADTEIANTAHLHLDGGCDNPEACESTDVDRTPPAVAIAKDDHQSVVNPGDALTYDITASNLSSDQPAGGVVVTDTLPAGLTFVSATNGGTYEEATRTVTWNVGELAPAGATTVQVTAMVDEGIGQDATIANTARVVTEHGCLNPDGCDSTDIDHTPAAVSIVKDDHTVTLKPGEDTTYDLTVTNASADQDATGAVVTDTLPAELTFVSATDGGVYDEATRTVTWNLGTVGAGSSKTVHVTATLDSSVAADAEIANTATLGTDQGCTVTSDCSSTDIDRTPALMSIVKDDHRVTLAPGAETTYDLTVTNESADQVAEKVVVTDVLPASLTFVSATDGGTYDPATRTVTWELGDVAASGVRTLHVTAQLDASTANDTEIVNVATVDTAAGCTVEQDCTSTDVNLTPPAVSISKDDHTSVVGLGDTLTYDLVVTNESANQTATGVVATDRLPAELLFVSATDNGAFNRADGTVVWNLGDLAPGESRTVQVTVTVATSAQAGAEIANTATVDTDQGCVDAECVSVDTDRTPDVTIAKDDHQENVISGQSLDYDLTITNEATYAATGVKASDVLPAELTFVSATDGGVYDEATKRVTWTIGDLAAGESKVVHVTATVADNLQDGVKVANTASVTTDHGCIGDGCSDVDTDTVDAPAAILAHTGSIISTIGLWATGVGIMIGGALLLLRRRLQGGVS